jgi:hypothetical protein
VGALDVMGDMMKSFCTIHAMISGMDVHGALLLFVVDGIGPTGVLIALGGDGGL